MVLLASRLILKHRSLLCAEYPRSEVASGPRNRKLSRRAAILAYAVLASIGIVCGARQAQNRAGLDSIFDEIPSGHQVSLRARLPLQVGFFDGATAIYITPEVGVDPNAPAAIIPPRIRSSADSTPISFLRTSGHALTLRPLMTSSCSLILPRETC